MEKTFNKAKDLSEMDPEKMAQKVAEERLKNKVMGKGGESKGSSSALIGKELELDKLKQKLLELQLKII